VSLTIRGCSQDSAPNTVWRAFCLLFCERPCVASHFSIFAKRHTLNPSKKHKRSFSFLSGCRKTHDRNMPSLKKRVSFRPFVEIIHVPAIDKGYNHLLFYSPCELFMMQVEHKRSAIMYRMMMEQKKRSTLDFNETEESCSKRMRPTPTPLRAL
jgi:hypothetical protein